jgi:CPA2 family monovalent cation:H+ antiporter-2
LKSADDLETIISMMHLPTLITDLGIILVIAALVTLLFKRLGQPLVLGYLIAGFFVSQHFPWLPTIQDKESISIWAEIGVIFLLFGLGLEFSFKKLVKVGGSAGFTAVFEVLVMVGIGYVVGRLLGWNNVDSIFLGGILSVSSTTIIVRAFQELNMKGNRFVDLVFGILVVEDIVAVLLLVLLPSLVVGESFSIGSLVGVSLRMVFFVLLWFILGIFLLPAFLRKIRDLLEEETTLIVAIGLCLVMVVIASAAGFSPALGAFVMGSLLAETPEGHHIEKLLNPVKNLFAAVFFVSVGTMIDPKVIMEHPGLILIITLVTIFGKFFSTYVGALLSGQSRKTSLQAGMSLAQIGEFSFIIASLGVSLKVTSDFLYPLAVAASAVTTFTTPYLIKSSEWTFEKADRFFPERLKNALDRYKASFQRQGSRSVGSLVMSTYGLKILLNSVVILAVIFAVKLFLSQYLEQAFPGNANLGILTFILCLVLSVHVCQGQGEGRILLAGQAGREQGAQREESEETQALHGDFLNLRGQDIALTGLKKQKPPVGGFCHNGVYQCSNMAEMDSSLLIRRMASASTVDRVSCLTLPIAFISAVSGMESVMISSSMTEFLMFSTAVPEKTGWVA